MGRGWRWDWGYGEGGGGGIYWVYTAYTNFSSMAHWMAAIHVAFLAGSLT
jgi:hypothetical protein